MLGEHRAGQHQTPLVGSQVAEGWPPTAGMSTALSSCICNAHLETLKQLLENPLCLTLSLDIIKNKENVYLVSAFGF